MHERWANSILVAFFSLFVIASFSLRQRNRPPEPAQMAIENLEIDRATAWMQFDLHNLTGKTVTGWALRFETQYQHGIATQWAYSDRIVAPGRLNFTGMEGPFLPGESRHELFPAATRNDAGAVVDYRVSIGSLIFADGTFSGDEHYIDAIFSDRKARFEELSYWLEKMESLKESRPSAIDALRGWAEELQSSRSSQTPQPPETRLAAENIRSELTGFAVSRLGEVGSGTATTEQVVAELIDLMGRYRSDLQQNLAGPASRNGQADESSDALRTLVAAFEREFNAHDPSRLSVFFAEDADMIMGDGPAVRGREAIQSWWEMYFKVQERETRASFLIKSAKILNDDLALLDTSTTTGGRDARGQELASW